jgi:hypothetical protein
MNEYLPGPTELALTELYTCLGGPDNNLDKTDVRHLRQAFIWEDIPFMTHGDHDNPIVSVPMLCSYVNTEVATVPLFEMIMAMSPATSNKQL